jgi:hypothetical protein
MNKLGWSALLVLASACSAPVGEDVRVVNDNLTVGAYNFRTATATPGKCLDVAGGGSADGTNIQQWACNNAGAQSFFAQDLGNGLVRIINTPTGKCMDIAGSGTADGTNIRLWTCNGSAGQTFRTDDTGGGYVRMVNPSSNKCVDVNGASSADGANVQLWTCNGTAAQLWQPVATTLVGGTYALGTLGGSSSCMDIWGGGTADGTNIDEWQCSGLWNQSFRVDSLGNGTVRLVNPTSSKCVDVKGGASADGTNVELYTCNGSGAQSFSVNDAGGGNVTFVNTNSNKCIDVNGSNPANGTNIQLWTCNSSPAQRFRPNLVPTKDTGCSMLKASATSITQGDAVTLTWSAPGATSFSLDLQDGYQNNPTQTSGTATVKPWRASTTYTATSKSGTTTNTCSVTINAQPGTPPHADVLYASGTRLYDNGQPYTMKGGNIDAFWAPLPYLNTYNNFYVSTAYNHFGVQELQYAQQFGMNTLNIKVSQSGLNPANPMLGSGTQTLQLTQAQHDQYVSEVHQAITLARHMGFAVNVTILGSSNFHEGMPIAETLTVALGLAKDFAYDQGVMFELFNEPWGTSTCTWNCYINGGVDQGITYVGVNEMISKIRALGAKNLILVESLVQNFQWLPATIVDPGNNLAYGVHPYFEFSQVGRSPAAWDVSFGNFAQSHPLVVTEWNEMTGTVGPIVGTIWCQTPTDVLLPLKLLNYVQQKGINGVAAWSFDNPLTFVTDSKGTPRTMVNTSNANGYYACNQAGGGVGVWLQQYFRGTLPPSP